MVCLGIGAWGLGSRVQRFGFRVERGHMKICLPIPKVLPNTVSVLGSFCVRCTCGPKPQIPSLDLAQENCLLLFRNCLGCNPKP